MSDDRGPMAEGNAKAQSIAAGRFANRRDLLKTATGVVAATVVGGAIMEASGGKAEAAPGGQPGRGGNSNVSVSIASQRVSVSFDALGFHFEASRPVDPASGQPTGGVEYPPVVVVKETDASTPKLLLALVEGIALDTVEIKWDAGQGQSQTKIELRLSDALITNIEQYNHFNAAEFLSADDPRVLESVSMNFAKLTILDING